MRKHLRKILLMVTMCVMALCLTGCGNQPKLEGVWGQVDATEVDINTKVAGRLVELFVKEGSQVKKGQILACIDAREQEAKMLAAKAQVEGAKAVAAQARANLANAREDFRRYDLLFHQGAASAQTYDAYKTKLEVAEQNYTYALNTVEAAMESLRQVEINFGETDLKAPFDGIIVTKYVDVGAMISTGMPIVAVQDPLDNWADFKVKETELSKYVVGAKVKVFGRDPNLQMDGTIVDVSSKPNFASYRTTSDRGDGGDIIAYNVKVDLHSAKIHPGMRVRLVIK